MCTQGLESELLKMFYRHFYDSFIYTYPILLFSIKLHAKNNKTLGGEIMLGKLSKNLWNFVTKNRTKRITILINIPTELAFQWQCDTTVS